MKLRQDADLIMKEAITKVLPDGAVRKALTGEEFAPYLKTSGKIYVVSVGKAAWKMAQAAETVLGKRLEKGIVLTKYHHVEGEIPGMRCLEAGHPIPDENSFEGTREILDMTSGLHSEDVVLFLLSGGGSALFEDPLVQPEELEDITRQLLACGADIKEINTIRKRLSRVKGGRFAKHCDPAKVFSVVLSDVLGDPLDMIASGPASPDKSTSKEALKIIEKYQLQISRKTAEFLKEETPKKLKNASSVISGNVRALCNSAKDTCEKLGYKVIVLTDQLSCEAREAGSFLASIAKTYSTVGEKLAFIAGGETVVHLKGDGKGGRNQELALSAAIGLEGLENTAIFSIGSDGTDGPTDAAGGYVDGFTKAHLTEQGIDIYQELENNNAYEALEKSGGLVITGPTGTNVNDLTVLLIRK
mgnify:CR=1 FL=1